MLHLLHEDKMPTRIKLECVYTIFLVELLLQLEIVNHKCTTKKKHGQSSKQDSIKQIWKKRQQKKEKRDEYKLEAVVDLKKLEHITSHKIV